jgi:hypothetical protein
VREPWCEPSCENPRGTIVEEPSWNHRVRTPVGTIVEEPSWGPSWKNLRGNLRERPLSRFLAGARCESRRPLLADISS